MIKIRQNIINLQEWLKKEPLDEDYKEILKNQKKSYFSELEKFCSSLNETEIEQDKLEKTFLELFGIESHFDKIEEICKSDIAFTLEVFENFGFADIHYQIVSEKNIYISKTIVREV